MFAQVRNFQLFRYFGEVRNELQKVSWPTKEQTFEKTALVITVSVLVGVYIGALDYVYNQITLLILK